MNYKGVKILKTSNKKLSDYLYLKQRDCIWENLIPLHKKIQKQNRKLNRYF